VLESLFANIPSSSLSSSSSNDEDVVEQIVHGCIVVLQSLLVLGMSYGVFMKADVLEQSLAHMKEPDDELHMQQPNLDVVGEWTPDSSRRLKYQSARDESRKLPGLQLLAALKKKRSPLGAYGLLVRMGVWEKHENLALLRSGFPLRFTEQEERAAEQAANNHTLHDPDELLGIRQDYRSQKIFTIDGASASEIDDGLSVEIIDEDKETNNGNNRYRYWIHIADADRWAPRHSELFEVARKRATSIYLADGAIPMMPSRISSEVMSLRANTDTFALSLGVELGSDGSIIDSSIVVTPSYVRVSYRLTYDEVDEMLEDGIGFNEEWELGQLLTAAQTRRKFRMKNGSAEAFVPNQIPQYSISTFPDKKSHDNIGIKVDIQVSHNGGKNQSTLASAQYETSDAALAEELPASSASTLVTEMMILAGEAIGKWAMRETRDQDETNVKNPILLPYRSQPKPDYRSRSRERKIMMDLLEYNVGGGYCHAWYSRRFLAPVKITAFPSVHAGLGLDCYVQWTSPIRRFQDLQVHSAVKRYLRRKKILELSSNRLSIPNAISSNDLGYEFMDPEKEDTTLIDLAEADKEIDYQDRTKLLGPARFVMKNSQKYWMLEFIRRLYESNPAFALEVLVLGCIQPAKRQYAIYIYELGLEWRYSSPVSIQAGNRFKVRISNVIPQNGQLTFVRIQ
jgi:exoribonuclease-2